MKPLKISIPKPCHEDWNKMTQNEKGRFCNSCAKNVVDFTKKSPQEIKDYLLVNQGKRVCGHFYKKQLDSITIEIPEQILHQKLSFTRVFTLALLIAMGTTLFSCKTDGKTQKIGNVVVVDSLEKVEKEIDTTLNKVKDSIVKKVPIVGKPILPPDVFKTTGIVCPPDKPNDSIIEIAETTSGDVHLPPPLDSINEIEEVLESEILLGMILEEPARFEDTKNLSISEAKEEFSKRISKLINENFDLEITDNFPKGKHKFWVKFDINKKGVVENIRVHTNYQSIEKEITKIIKELPEFIPATQRNKPVKTSFSLPISFTVE